MEKITTGIKCIKYLLFIFNLIFWLAGTAVLAVALWLRFDSKTTAIFGADQCPTYFCVGIYILMGAGAVMMIIGFFGCCGAIQESQCLLGSFFACLLVVFAAEIAAGVWGFLNKDKIIVSVETYYKDELKNVKMNQTIETIHKALNCCETPSENYTCSTEQQEDCIKKLKEFFSSKLYIIGIVGITIAGVMIFGMVFSMVLCCAIRNSQYSM